MFRAYYILIAALAIAVYCILRLFHRFVNLPRVVRLLGILLSMYVLVCAVMFVARVAKPDEFQLIMSVRDASLAGRDADTRPRSPSFRIGLAVIAHRAAIFRYSS